jgi:hypothetical protein
VSFAKETVKLSSSLTNGGYIPAAGLNHGLSSRTHATPQSITWRIACSIDWVIPILKTWLVSIPRWPSTWPRPHMLRSESPRLWSASYSWQMSRLVSPPCLVFWLRDF